jgi:hypothetical protein
MLGSLWCLPNVSSLPESLRPACSVSEIAEGSVRDGTNGVCMAGVAGNIGVARRCISASRLREALARVSVMLANCRPSSPFMTVELARTRPSIAVVPVRLFGARRRAEALFRRILSFGAAGSDYGMYELTVLKLTGISLVTRSRGWCRPRSRTLILVWGRADLVRVVVGLTWAKRKSQWRRDKTNAVEPPDFTTMCTMLC